MSKRLRPTGCSRTGRWQEELANWMRFSSKDAEKYCHGLTAASMEIEGISRQHCAEFLRQRRRDEKSFRKKSIDKVNPRSAIPQAGC